MSSSLNKVTLIGNLGADPDVRNTQDGRQIVNLNIATTESWKDKQSGERRDKTEWHKVVIFADGLGKIASQYLKKGSKVYIEGQLQTRKWQDKDGQDRYTTEIVIQNFNGTLILLDSREKKQEFTGNDYASASRGGQPSSYNYSKPAPSPDAYASHLDDEVPF